MPGKNNQEQLLGRVKALVGQACDLSSCFPDPALAPCLSLTGKLSRPRLLLAMSHALQAGETDSVSLGASVETIHNASLLHDDVVDDATLRRGKKSLHLGSGNRIAIMAGDILLARGWALACRTENVKVHRAVAEATAKMAEGQLVEDARRGDVSLSINDYLQIVDGKTGSLLSLCLVLPALLAGLPEEAVTGLHEAGLLLGRAFQVADDLLDLNLQANETGKDTFQDLAMGKMTYPYLLLRDQGNDERERLGKLLGKKDIPVREVFHWVDYAGVLEQAKAEAGEWLDSANEVLKELLPEERSGAVFQLLFQLNERILHPSPHRK